MYILERIPGVSKSRALVKLIYIYIGKTFKIACWSSDACNASIVWSRRKRTTRDPIPVWRGIPGVAVQSVRRPLLNQYLVYIAAWNRTLVTDTRHRYHAANKVTKTATRFDHLLIYRFGVRKLCALIDRQSFWLTSFLDEFCSTSRHRRVIKDFFFFFTKFCAIDSWEKFFFNKLDTNAHTGLSNFDSKVEEERMKYYIWHFQA